MKLHLSDELLYKPTEQFDFYNPPMEPQKLVDLLGEAMCDLGGVGLSANQVGLPYRVFVMGNPTNRESIIPVFNPSIIHWSDEQEVAEEGCLSLPGYLLALKRPTEIRVRMSTVDDNRDSARFNGYTARVFQHEYDHMEGIDFRSRATRFHKERADKNYKLLLRRQKHNAA
jgi:peptide deformylase